MKLISTTKEWQDLEKHCQEIVNVQMQDLFLQDKERFNKFSLQAANLFLDFSKNRITDITFDLLLKLAKKSDLKNKIAAMFDGKKINNTENRAVLHTALRNPNNTPLIVDNKNIMPIIHQTITKMGDCAEKIRTGKWKGYSNKTITDIVNIGIGGSDLGPAMVTSALTPYSSNNINCHFVSNVDATNIAETLKYLNPETTLFIIASKTFTTQETLCNANTARDWLLQKANTKDAIAQHMLAVSAKPARAIEFGVNAENVFPFWDFVGGRYSLWSAIGLSIAIAIGIEHFKELLLGAFTMDEHFQQAPFNKNLPITLGLIGIWNNNFLGATTQAILPYDQYLHLFPAYLQQLDMESNGKHVTTNGQHVDYNTGQIIWGAPGTNGQHAFHQLLMQGTRLVPADFIIAKQSHNPLGEHQQILFANCLAQSQALMQGRDKEQILKELTAQGLDKKQAQILATHKIIPGNIPSNTILMDKLTPKTLGALIALYEHKVFVQGIIWGINSFDQWGVELGKKLTNNILPALIDTNQNKNFDASTQGLINLLNR